MPLNRPLKLGLAILALGSGPLLLYVLFGPEDGNPIGLGLLFFFSFPAALACMAVGGAQVLLNRKQEPGADPVRRAASGNAARKHPDDWG